VGEGSILFRIEDVKSITGGFGDGAVEFHFDVVAAGSDGFFNTTLTTQSHIFSVPGVGSLVGGDGRSDPAESCVCGSVNKIESGNDAGLAAPLDSI